MFEAPHQKLARDRAAGCSRSGRYRLFWVRENAGAYLAHGTRQSPDILLNHRVPVSSGLALIAAFDGNVKITQGRPRALGAPQVSTGTHGNGHEENQTKNSPHSKRGRRAADGESSHRPA